MPRSSSGSGATVSADVLVTRFPAAVVVDAAPSPPHPVIASYSATKGGFPHSSLPSRPTPFRALVGDEPSLLIGRSPSCRCLTAIPCDPRVIERDWLPLLAC
jgi:hypothetical protein